MRWISVLPFLFVIIAGAELLRHSGDSQCTTEQCNTIAQNIFSMLNTTADPCEEPHLFFCGKWMKEFELPSDESSWTLSFGNVRNETREHLRKILDDGKCPDFTVVEGEEDSYDDMLSCFFQTCMDTARSDRLGAKPLVDQMIANTPFLYERAFKPDLIDAEATQLNQTQKVKFLSERLAKLLSLGVSSWISLAVDPSVLSDSGEYSLYLSESGLSLQYRQYEQSDAVEAYLDYITNLLAAFTVEVQDLPAEKMEEVKREAKERASAVLAIEQDVKAITLTPEQQRNPKLTLNLRSREEMRSVLSGGLDLDVVLQPLLDMAGDDANEEVLSKFIVDNPSFMEKLSTLIQTKWTWGAIHDYLLIRTIRSFANGLSEEYRDIVDQFQSRMLGSAKPPRWRRCQVSATNNLGWILSLRYLNSIEKPERRKEISEEMVKSLKVTYAEVIQNVKWMDEKTKKIALKKLNATVYKLAYPDWLPSDHNTYFNRYYGEPNTDVVRDYVNASVHIQNAQTRFKMSRLGSPKDKTEWEMFPQEVNAYFNPVQNEIVFPLSIMQSPFLRVWTECSDDKKDEECSSDAEKAFMQILTFGGLGSVVGHELTHGFDDQGRQFDESGKLMDWWSEESSDAFDKAASCISDQYGSYALRLHRPSRDADHPEWVVENVPVSGKLTLGENIADNGGIKLAYLALQRLHPEYFTTQIVPSPLSEIGINSAGLFSSSFAQIWCDVSREKALLQRISGDPHSPNPFRIIGTLTNFGTYSDAFECLPGSRVNPSTKQIRTNEAEEFEVYRRSMLAEKKSIVHTENEYDTLIFDPLNGVVSPHIGKTCEVW